jgi:dipeptidyl aminopeptidase/acylaminoacyl peptidase
MLRFVLAGVSALALSSAVAAGTLSEDAKAFGTRQLLRNVDISPSGKKVVMVVSGPGASSAATVVDIGTSNLTQVARTDGNPQNLYWCAFAGEEHLICQVGGIDRIQNDLASFSRLLSVNSDGSKMKPLGLPSSGRASYVMQSDGNIIDWMTGAEGQVLMQRNYVPDAGNTGHLLSRTKEGLGVDLVDLESGDSSPIEPARESADSYMTDGQGNVRILGDAGASYNTGQLTGVETFRYRTAGSKEWLDLGQYNAVTREGILPLAVDAERNALFALRRINGRDALVQIALDGTMAQTLVAKNDRVDIDGVVRIGRGQRVIGYTYAEERRHVIYFDPEFGKLHDALAKALPATPEIDFEQASRDGKELLIRASSADSPGRFYVYFRPTHELKIVGPIRPELEGRKLASVKPITIPASDGVSIPAYLTLPPGSSGKNLPAVVLPHGGPSARDEWNFDWLPQFLAARGYAVVQPNYRGSDGYGDAWLGKNGFQAWRTSIGDVTSAAKYLVSQGIADPNRLAILGWSYGGYAALQSAVMEPNLYKAAIAIAPVTDFAMAKTEAENFTSRELVKRMIGSGPHITEGSPLQNAERIKIPVLLVHGDMDANVSIHESKAMLSALKKAGTPAEMLTFKGLDHQLDDSDARIQLLTKAGELLDRTIGH